VAEKARFDAEKAAFKETKKDAARKIRRIGAGVRRGRKRRFIRCEGQGDLFD
jgi:hypothetical protein